jgi:hypothetical protein
VQRFRNPSCDSKDADWLSRLLAGARLSEHLAKFRALKCADTEDVRSMGRETLSGIGLTSVEVKRLHRLVGPAGGDIESSGAELVVVHAETASESEPKSSGSVAAPAAMIPAAGANLAASAPPAALVAQLGYAVPQPEYAVAQPVAVIESQPQSGSRKARCICDVLSAVAIVAFIAIGVTLALQSATNERKTPNSCSEDQEAVLLSCADDCDACDVALTRLQLDACTRAGGEAAHLALATACPLPVDCAGSWSEYGSCSATCGGGTQTRAYTVSRAAAHGGSSCPHDDGETEVESCNTESCWRYGARGEACSAVCSSAGMGCESGDSGVHDEQSMRVALEAAGQSLDATCPSGVYSSSSDGAPWARETGHCYYRQGSGSSSCSRTYSSHRRLCRCV